MGIIGIYSGANLSVYSDSKKKWINGKIVKMYGNTMNIWKADFFFKVVLEEPIQGDNMRFFTNGYYYFDDWANRRIWLH